MELGKARWGAIYCVYYRTYAHSSRSVQIWFGSITISARLYIVTSPADDEVIKWKHFPRYWSFVRGIHRSPVNSLHKGRWRGARMFSWIYTWISGWVNKRKAGDLRHHRAHYDVTVMDSLHAYANTGCLAAAIPHMLYLATLAIVLGIWNRRLKF